jgi:glutathione S-transferase
MRRMHTLVAIPYSPWSEKARWALDHHGVPYRESSYQPMIGEPALRARTGRLRGKVTVPIFLERGEPAIMGSFAIARRAEAAGSGASLFPDGLDAEIDAWDKRLDAAMAECRARVIERTRMSDEAQAEALRGVVPDGLRHPLRSVTKTALGFLERKYRDVAPPAGTLESTLEALREALDRGAGHVVGKPSFADIGAATLLQGVKPVDGRFIRLGRATRATWTDEALASRFEDLVAWRDALYRERRAPRA